MSDLACPACGTRGEADERFCARCGMPLTHPDIEVGELTERQARARKISPQYGEGALVKVGWARNQAEAELISGLLLEEGIPSVARRSGGFDVPDFLAAGPRDILVAASGEDVARDVLKTDTEPARLREREPLRAPAWVRALAVLLVVVVVAIVLTGVVSAVL